MRRFTARGTNTAFTCAHCGAEVPPLDNGSYRNHCPYCLYSLHVDINPGDRANECKGVLEPIAVDYNSKKGWLIIHQCQSCGEIRRNKAALDDSVSDDFERIVAFSTKGSNQ